MLRNVDDALGKNVLRDTLGLRGLAQTEAEVPPGNAKRIDIWFVPDFRESTGWPDFTGILAEMTAEPSTIELWSEALSEDDFHTANVKRDLWRETLEQRDKRSWPRPMLWHVCAGKPETVLAEHGFEPTDIPGWYRPRHRGWRVNIVVIGELPVTRSTLLLRLLGRGRVRRDALRELRALPVDAWEKQLAQPWLLRLGLVVPLEQPVLPEDKELVVDIQAWYREFLDTHAREVEARVLRDIEAQRAEERRQLEAQRAEERRMAEINQLIRQFEHRLGRRLATDERAVLNARVETLGSAHVADLVLDLSTPDLAAWLKFDVSVKDH